MAVGTPVLRANAGSTTIATSHASASFTPTANSLMVAVWSPNHPVTPPTVTGMSDTFTGSGSWTEAVEEANGSGAIAIWTMRIGASPGSGAVTGSYSSSGARTGWVIFDVPDVDISSPVSESAGANGTSSTLTVTLVGIAAGNLAIGGVSSTGDTDGITPGTGETEIGEGDSGGGSNNRVQAEYGTGTAVDWSALATTQNNGVAIELAAVAAAFSPKVMVF